MTFNLLSRGAAGALAALAICAVASPAHAGQGGAEFAAIWTTLSGWMEGTLGRIAAGAMVLVGLLMGIVRQSLVAFVAGVGGALGVYTTPVVINGIVTGTAPLDATLLEAAPPALDLIAIAGAM